MRKPDKDFKELETSILSAFDEQLSVPGASSDAPVSCIGLQIKNIQPGGA